MSVQANLRPLHNEKTLQATKAERSNSVSHLTAMRRNLAKLCTSVCPS